MHTLSKRLTGISLVLLLVFFTLPFSSFAQTADLKKGDHGDRVKALKVRLFDLGYLQSVKNITDRYSDDTAGYVQEFQFLNDLPETGIADAKTLEKLYAEGAIKAPLSPDRPSYNIDPDYTFSITPPNLPPLDSRGFLLAGGNPYVYQNRESGFWLYLSDQIKVTITRHYQTAKHIEWFEVYVSYKEAGKPFTVESKRNGAVLESPIKLAEQAGAVVAINDDFYSYRLKYKQRTGIVVRDGEIKADRTYTQDRSRIPSLEVMALFEDGRLKTFASDAYTAQEYLDMKVTDTFAFGPALVQEGEVPRYFYSKDYRSYVEPRTAIGMVGENEYCALIITGRKDGSRGANFGWMAEKMYAMGAREALNLDGGGTVALVFMGELLNKSEKNQSTRSVSGLIAFK